MRCKNDWTVIIIIIGNLLAHFFQLKFFLLLLLIEYMVEWFSINQIIDWLIEWMSEEFFFTIFKFSTLKKKHWLYLSLYLSIYLNLPDSCFLIFVIKWNSLLAIPVFNYIFLFYYKYYIIWPGKKGLTKKCKLFHHVKSSWFFFFFGKKIAPSMKMVSCHWWWWWWYDSPNIHQHMHLLIT